MKIGGYAALLSVFLLGASDIQAQSGPAAATAATPVLTERFEWVTLGTQGGPIPSSIRGQPANLLVKKGAAVLVDAGDGAVSRMLISGAPLPTLRYVFLSHLHADHIGGLFGVLGLRHQLYATTPLTIYGPPGVKALVAGIVAGLTPSSEAGYGVDGEVQTPPDANLTVVEVRGGDTLTLPDMTVRVARNTHYTFSASNPLDKRFQSVSYRFDLPDRSIVYTGDTGPSDAVVDLARGADLLISEMIDLDWTRQAPPPPRGRGADPIMAVMMEHLTKHHLSPEDVADLATRAGVKRVVITHLANGGAQDGAEGRYVARIQAKFDGPVVVANDYDRF